MSEERAPYGDNGQRPDVQERARAIMQERAATVEAEAYAEAERELSTGEQDAEAERSRIRLTEDRIKANRAKVSADRRLSDAILALTKAMEHQDAAAQVARRADAAVIAAGGTSEYSAFRPDLIGLGIKTGEVSTGVLQILVLRELYISPPPPPPPGRNLGQQLFDASTVAKTLAGGPPSTPIKPFENKE